MTTTITLRPFTEFDWMGFAGAEEAPNGAEPQIADAGITVNDVESLVLVSSGAVEIHVGEDRVWTMALPASYDMSIELLVARSLPTTMTERYLELLGFKRLGATDRTWQSDLHEDR